MENSWKGLRRHGEAPVSDRAPIHSGKPLLDRLPRPQRDALIGIGRRGRGLFGRAFQRVFDENLPIFEFLAAQGATAAVIGRLLAEVGIVRADGTALPEGTVTSALSRARERAGRAPALHAPASDRQGMQPDAGDCRAMQASAGVGIRPPNPGRAQSHPPFDPQPHRPPRGDHLLRPAPTQPTAGFGLPEHTRRAAALLEDLRSEKDEGSY